MYNQLKRIHLIGIGGIGMSGIAELLLRHGHTVTGSDSGKSDTIRKLEALGIKIFEGHHAQNVEGAEVVVYSSAISEANPELSSAKEKAIPVIPRAEMLAELMRMRWGIAVAGAHGKTTTTSLVSLALVEGGLDPTIVVGGRMDNFGGTNARMGSGNFMVVEADESDGSFSRLSPSIAVVTNLDREHMEHYKTMRRLRSAFLTFLEKVPFYGLCVLCGDDPSLRLMSAKVTRRKKTYGFSEGCTYRLSDYQAHTSGTSFKIRVGTESLEMRLQIPGRHNALNAVAALCVADELGVPRQTTLKALASFQGVQRRFQKRGEKNGVIFYDDYAHHPSEIRATLSAARERFPTTKIRVVFQPHRYTRVADLFDEFAECFKGCDSVAVTDVYAAGETPIPGVDGALLADNIRKTGKEEVVHVTSPLDGVSTWLAQSRPGDMILTLGAGDLPNVYKELF
jgi:UDP-N-acetylmuramate--alanine ligase